MSQHVPIPAYVSARSANALISDLAPTSLTPEALLHLNLVLDELVASLIIAAQSIAPNDIKHRAIAQVFASVTVSSAESIVAPAVASSPKTPRTLRTRRAPPSSQGHHFRAVSTSVQVTRDGAALALGREAINEAELEVKAWRDARGGAEDGFVTDPRGLRTGMQEGGSFPIAQAVDLLRCRIMAYSTLGNDTPDPGTVRALADTWARVGGSTREDVLDPAALYFTAIVEHVAERILAGLGKLMAGSSNTATTARLYDLYSALCEDEATWGFFKRMAVKSDIEKQLAITPTSSAYNLGRTTTRDSRTSLSLARVPAAEQQGISTTATGGIRGPSLDLALTTPLPPLATTRKLSLSRRAPSFDGNAVRSSPLNKRASSALLQTMPGAGAVQRRVSMDEARANGAAREDEFDAVVASGETLKVSLTPSRLKRFVSGNAARTASPARAPTSVDASQPSLHSHHRQSSHSSLTSPPAALESLKLVPRDETAFGKRSSEQRRPNGESLAEVLQSEPPWGRQADRKMRPTAADLPVLGKPVDATSSSIPLSPRVEVPPPKKGRSETAELQDFLVNTPPPAARDTPRDGAAQSDVQNESPGRLRSLIGRVAGGKQADRRGSASDQPTTPSERRASSTVDSSMLPTSPTPDRRTSTALARGLFSSRDRHIEDEFIGPSTVDTALGHGRRGDALVEVGSVNSAGASSVGGMNISSPTSIDPEVHKPIQSNGAAAAATGLAIEAELRPLKELPNGNQKPLAEVIPVEDILQLRQDIRDARQAEECWTLVDQLLRRYGLSADEVALPAH